MILRGLSLLEALVVASLVSVVVGLLAGLAQEYSRVTRFSSTRSQRLENLMQLDKVRADLRQAVQILEPLPGSLSSAPRLRFRRVLPDARATRLPIPPDLPGAVWDPAKRPGWPPSSMR